MTFLAIFTLSVAIICNFLICMCSFFLLVCREQVLLCIMTCEEGCISTEGLYGCMGPGSAVHCCVPTTAPRARSRYQGLGGTYCFKALLIYLYNFSL